jgi:hypothetical protein
MFTFDATRARVPTGRAEYGAEPRAPRHGAHLIDAIAGTLSRVRDACAYRHDAYVRREIAERHDQLAHLYDAGGDFSDLP